MIKIDNITKSYSKNENEKILKGISINFGETGFVTILGKSGSGKTTLLNIIGGLDKGKGTIYYDETKISKYNSKVIDLYRSKHIGYVFQNYLLMQDLTVYENIDIALSLSGINNKGERKKRIDKCLKAVGMERYKRRVSSALSGGQQQRVAIARALSKNTDVLICDEPTGNLDSINSKAIMNILRGISKHRLVILVTHNEDLAYQYSDRIIRLVDGKVESDKENISSINNDQNYVIDKSKLQKTQIENGKINVDFYSNQNIEDIKLSIISYENKLKIIVESGQTMLDERYQIVEKVLEKQDDSDIDISFDENFDNRKEKSKLWNKITKSFSRVTNIKRGKKALYHGFFVFGVLLSLILYLYQITSSFNDSVNPRMHYDNQIVLIEDEKSDNLVSQFKKEEVMKWFNDPDSSVTGIEPIKGIVYSLKEIFVPDNIPSGKLGYSSYSATDTEVDIIYQSQYKKYFNNLKYGCLPQKENEIIVSTKLIDTLACDYMASYDLIEYNDFINCYFDFGVHYGRYYISGIAESNFQFIGCTDSNYLEFVNASFMNITSRYKSEEATMISKTSQFLKDDYIKNHDFNLLSVDNKNLNNEYNSRQCNVYLTKKYYSDYYYTTTYSYFNFRGVVDSDENALIFEKIEDYNLFLNRYFLKTDFLNYTENYFMFKSIDSLDKEKVRYLEGNQNLNYNDIIVSKTLYDRKKEFTFGNVVGYFDDNGSNVGDVYVSNLFGEILINTPDTVYIFSRDFYLISDNLEKTKTFFEDYGLIAMNSNQYDQMRNGSMINSIFFVIIFIILILSGLFIYLMNRSKMIKNIYTIGVFRSIGVKKNVIYKVFLLDSILITTLTMALGYTFASLVIYYTCKMFLMEYLSWWLFILGLIGVYGINILSSLLPLFLLLRKTPREITIKYDI